MKRNARQNDNEENSTLQLIRDEKGLALVGGGQEIRGDFTKMLPRLKQANLERELLVKAARIKNASGPLIAVDATAGLGEDAILLAAAGYNVKMFERDATIAELLQDALERAKNIPELQEITGRMELIKDDSIREMPKLDPKPDVILLDPMFPARQKSAMIKKKFQMLQQLESPCEEEGPLLEAALEAQPRKIIIKRPAKGPNLAGRKPDYVIGGKAIRYDCIVVAPGK